MFSIFKKPFSDSDKISLITNIFAIAIPFVVPVYFSYSFNQLAYDFQKELLWIFVILLLITSGYLYYWIIKFRSTSTDQSIFTTDQAIEKIIDAIQDDSLASVHYFEKFKNDSFRVTHHSISDTEAVLTLDSIVEGKERLIPQNIRYAIYNTGNQKTANAVCISRTPKWQIKLEDPYDPDILNTQEYSQLNIHFIRPDSQINSEIVHLLISEIKKLGS